MADKILTMNGLQAASASGTLNLLQTDFISGLKLIWNSTNSISVSSGAACRPSDGLLLAPAATVTKSSLSLTASTWYHVYLYLNSTTPDIEIVTTAPASTQYFGVAYAKNGDTSRRYLGSLLTDASSNILRFVHTGNKMLVVGNANQRVINDTTTTWTSASLANVAPATATMVVARPASQATTNTWSIGWASGLQFYGQTTPGSSLVDAPIGTGNVLWYAWASSPSAGGVVDVVGYIFER